MDQQFDPPHRYYIEQVKNSHVVRRQRGCLGGCCCISATLPLLSCDGLPDLPFRGHTLYPETGTSTPRNEASDGS